METLSGQIIAESLLNPDVEITIELMNDAMNSALEILKESNNGSLTFGRRKKTILENMAESLIQTFSRLVTPIRDGESHRWSVKITLTHISSIMQNFIAINYIN